MQCYGRAPLRIGLAFEDRERALRLLKISVPDYATLTKQSVSRA